MGIPARPSDTERTTGRNAHPTNSNTNVIIVCGYHRRDEELADAKAALR